MEFLKEAGCPLNELSVAILGEGMDMIRFRKKKLKVKVVQIND
jgi:hypothetical protein